MGVGRGTDFRSLLESDFGRFSMLPLFSGFAHSNLFPRGFYETDAHDARSWGLPGNLASSVQKICRLDSIRPQDIGRAQTQLMLSCS